MEEPLLASNRLVGDTALALQMGYRKSTDLGLFTFDEPDRVFKTPPLSKKKA